MYVVSPQLLWPTVLPNDSPVCTCVAIVFLVSWRHSLAIYFFCLFYNSFYHPVPKTIAAHFRFCYGSTSLLGTSLFIDQLLPHDKITTSVF